MTGWLLFKGCTMSTFCDGFFLSDLEVHHARGYEKVLSQVQMEQFEKLFKHWECDFWIYSHDVCIYIYIYIFIHTSIFSGLMYQYDTYISDEFISQNLDVSISYVCLLLHDATASGWGCSHARWLLGGSVYQQRLFDWTKTIQNMFMEISLGGGNSNICLFSPGKLGKIPILTHIF